MTVIRHFLPGGYSVQPGLKDKLITNSVRKHPAMCSISNQKG